MGYVEYIMNTLEPATQTQLVSSSANPTNDPKGTHEMLTEFALTGKMQILGTQQDHVPNLMFLQPVVLVIIALLIALSSLHMLLSFPHNVSNVPSKGSSFMLATGSSHNKVQW